MICPKCNKNFQQFVTADNLAGLCDDCFEKEMKKNETNKIFDYIIEYFVKKNIDAILANNNYLIVNSQYIANNIQWNKTTIDIRLHIFGLNKHDGQYLANIYIMDKKEEYSQQIVFNQDKIDEILDSKNLNRKTNREIPNKIEIEAVAKVAKEVVIEEKKEEKKEDIKASIKASIKVGIIDFELKNKQNKKLSWHLTFLDIANLISKHSTCVRIQVGAVLVDNGRIVSIGYNGTPSGVEHCCDIFGEKYKLVIERDNTGKIANPDLLVQFKKEHNEFSRINEIHAEINTILNCSVQVNKLKNPILYCTISPCNNCAKTILAAGIKEVYYTTLYDRETDGIKFLKNNGIICEQILR